MKILNATYFVYRHVRLDNNEVFYIGLGHHQRKWKYQRALTTKNRNRHWSHIVQKNNGLFIVHLLWDNLTKEEAVKKEQEFIKLYGRQDLKKGTLCNLTDGGEGVNGLSEETRKKIGDSNRGVNSAMYGKKHDTSFILKMSKRMSGAGNPNFGKSLPDYQKEINRRAQLGRKHSAETIEKRASKLRKKILNQETGQIFSSITDCAAHYNKSGVQMTRLVKQQKFTLKFL